LYRLIDWVNFNDGLLLLPHGYRHFRIFLKNVSTQNAGMILVIPVVLGGLFTIGKSYIPGVFFLMAAVLALYRGSGNR